MPNRIIHESAFTSEKIAALTDFEFRLWVGLITLADDLGRGDARPAIVRGRLFPFHEKLTNRTVERALDALERLGCIERYTVRGKPYFCFPHWEEHQRVHRRLPTLRQLAAKCGRMRRRAANSGLNPNPNPNPIRNRIRIQIRKRIRNKIRIRTHRRRGARGRRGARRGMGVGRLSAPEASRICSASRLPAGRTKNAGRARCRRTRPTWSRFWSFQYIHSPPCSLTAFSSIITAMPSRLMGGVREWIVSMSSRS